jgi:hypothetical protein
LRSGDLEKKKPKKKKKAAPMTSQQAMELQSEPPRVGLSTIFKNRVYPVGEIQEYANEYVGCFVFLFWTPSRLWIKIVTEDQIWGFAAMPGEQPTKRNDI